MARGQQGARTSCRRTWLISSSTAESFRAIPDPTAPDGLPKAEPRVKAVALGLDGRGSASSGMPPSSPLRAWGAFTGVPGRVPTRDEEALRDMNALRDDEVLKEAVGVGGGGGVSRCWRRFRATSVRNCAASALARDRHTVKDRRR